MKQKSLLFILCLTLFAGCRKDFDETTYPAPEGEGGSEVVEQEIRMKLDRETADAINITRTRSGRILTGDLSFDELCERYRIIEIKRLFDDNGCAERTRKAGLDLWYTIRFEGPADRIMKDFGEVPGVTHVETPLRIARIEGTESTAQLSPAREVMFLFRAVPETYPFNDPLFEGQWPLYNDGSVYQEAVAGADINIIPAWTKTAGRDDVIVAVLDEGVQYDHPDLAANMWSGIGRNFCKIDNSAITWGKGHGTHVAGTIAAVNNNDVGISGMAGGTGSGDGVKIMTCQIFHPTDGRYDASSNATADAIKYAADNGAVICQNSWGYAAGSMSLDQWINQDRAVKEAIDYFIQYAGMSPDGQTQTGPMAGGVVIFAAGNENSGQPGYPAAYEPCISVAAVSCTYEAAWYTNYGPTVDICAPGGGDAADFSRPIHYNEGYNLSTLPTDLQNGMTFVYTNFRGEVETHTIDYVSETLGYGYMQGTSMACPHVSGVAALIVSQFGAPGFTNEQLKETLFSTARDIDSYQGPIYNGRGTYAGKIGKLVDAGAALDSGEVPPVSDQPTITPATGQNDTFTLGASERKTLQYTLAGYTEWRLDDPSGKIAKSIDGNVVTLTIDASQYAAGSYTAELLAMNGTKTAKRTIAYTVSKGDNPTGISMDFYPNPCTDVLNILPNYSGESTIRIRNSMGTEVMNITLGLINEEPVKLDVSGLASGTYLVQVTYNGIQITRTIVKR